MAFPQTQVGLVRLGFEEEKYKSLISLNQLTGNQRGAEPIHPADSMMKSARSGGYPGPVVSLVYVPGGPMMCYLGTSRNQTC